MTLTHRLARRLLTALTGVDVLAVQDSAERSFRRAALLEDDLLKLRAEHEQLRAKLVPPAGTMIRWRGVSGVQS